MSVWDGTFRLEQIPEPPSEFALVLTAASDVHSPISCIRVQGTASEPKIICAIQQGCLTILQNNEHARKMLCQEGAMKLFDQFAALGGQPKHATVCHHPRPMPNPTRYPDGHDDFLFCSRQTLPNAHIMDASQPHDIDTHHRAERSKQVADHLLDDTDDAKSH